MRRNTDKQLAQFHEITFETSYCIVKHMIENREKMTAGQIAKACNLPPSTVHNSLRRLYEVNVVMINPSEKNFKIKFKVRPKVKKLIKEIFRLIEEQKVPMAT